MGPLNELNLLMRSRGLQSPSEDKGPISTAPGQALKPENKQREVFPQKEAAFPACSPLRKVISPGHAAPVNGCSMHKAAGQASHR